jgi:lipoprotein NlpD
LSSVLLAMTAAALMAACGSSPRLSAPAVVDRSTRSAAAAAALNEAAGASTAQAGNPGVVVSAVGPTPAEAPTKPLPGAENAGKPGYYTVKPGDTMIRIGLETGQNWRDLARWNGMENTNVIEVGQVLRVLPPGTDGGTAVSTKPVATARVEPRGLDAKPAPAGSAPAASAPGSPAAVPALPAAPVAAAPATASVPAVREADDLSWGWPASGTVLAGYDEARNKGLSIGGKAGDSVLAAADGRVVYAGSGLRGYGNLVILKHNTTYLTAYAHNQSLLVKEDQQVKRGQKIAEMGSTDAERVQLHFEIRKLGKPVDPARLLPPR